MNVKQMSKHLSAALFRLNGGYCSWIFLLEVVMPCDVSRHKLTTPLPTERFQVHPPLKKNKKKNICKSE